MQVLGTVPGPFNAIIIIIVRFVVWYCMVKASALRAEGPGFGSRLQQDFSGSSPVI